MDSRQGVPTVNPMLLQHTLRALCTDSRWIYAVFWRILPRNYPPPQWDTEAGIMDRSKGNKRNWILVWEDGFCNFSACNDARRISPFVSVQQQRRGNDGEADAMNPALFFKMSHEVYNYGEGLMGKVADDNSHKWVYREPPEIEPSFFSLDPHPRTWEAQFKSGIQTIAVVAVQEGVLQFGSTNKIPEDLSFVLYMQRKFSFLNSIIPTVLNPASSINQFLSPRVGPGPWRATHNVAGMKRPPERIEPPVASKALNTGQLHRPLHSTTSPQTATTLLPSMSSLQALLSKLPSVKLPPDDSDDNNNHGKFQVAAGGSFATTWFLQPGHRNGMPEDESIVTSSSFCFSAEEDPREDRTRNAFKPWVAKQTQRPSNSTSFFDSFDTVFPELGVQEEAVENGDDSIYSSFLNEICS